MITLDELVSIERLNKCAYLCTKQSTWKETTQRYLINLLVNNINLRDDILKYRYSISQTTNFTLNERGHLRKIEAPAIRDRIIQKALTETVLIPSIIPYIIYDNYASIKNRGTSFARKRFEILLRKYIFHYGASGYILLIDIKKYFESIDHQVLKDIVADRIKNESNDIKNLIYYIIDNSSKINKGLNLGSEAPQILAVYYLNIVDTYVKVVKSIKYYGRYMDDIFIIGNSKEELQELLNQIKNILIKIKLEVNIKKTQIIKLTHGFTFLQTKYNVLPSGKILKRITHNKIVRERRRLKGLKRLYNENILEPIDIKNCYLSWRGSIEYEHLKSYKSLYNMDVLYKSLFPNEIKKKPKSRKIIYNEIFENAETQDLKYLVA